MQRTACCILLMASVAACAQPSTTSYGEKEVGQTFETSQGSVVASRIVDVTGEPGYLGAGAGAAVGAAGGSLAVNGPASLLVAIVGGLVGAGIGYMSEKQLSDRDGIEYVLQMDDGRVVTVVQNRDSDEEPLPDGTPVLVQLNGQYTRIMTHPSAVDRNPAGDPGGWVDPDATPGSTAPGTEAAPATGTPAQTSTRDLLLQGSDRARAMGDPEPPTTSTAATGQQQ